MNITTFLVKTIIRINEFFNDYDKTASFLNTKNPMLGGFSPIGMLTSGRHKKVLQFIDESLPPSIRKEMINLASCYEIVPGSHYLCFRGIFIQKRRFEEGSTGWIVHLGIRNTLSKSKNMFLLEYFGGEPFDAEDRAFESIEEAVDGLKKVLSNPELERVLTTPIMNHIRDNLPGFIKDCK